MPKFLTSWDNKCCENYLYSIYNEQSDEHT